MVRLGRIVTAARAANRPMPVDDALDSFDRQILALFIGKGRGAADLHPPAAAGR